MDTNEFFNKEICCPVCKGKFHVRVIKGSGIKMVKRDEDFCPYFEPVNKLFYEVWLCHECGYAAMQDKFENITDSEIKKIKNKIMKNWVKRNFSGEHTIETALEAYKLALLSLQIINGKHSDLVKVTIRIAWLYRFLKDPKEMQYLEATLNSYMEVYQREKFPVGNLDERTCMYMIGELCRRIGQRDEAAKWFYNVISLKEEIKKDNIDNPEETEKNTNKTKKDTTNIKVIVNMAREQLQNIKQQK